MKTFVAVIMYAFLLSIPGVSFAQEPAKTSGIQLVDARLGKDVKDRAVVDEDSVFSKGSKVFLWMKFTGGASDQVTVTWKTATFSHNTSIVVGGSPWRTWASKTVGKSGDWTVTVTDAGGKVLKELSFKVE